MTETPRWDVHEIVLSSRTRYSNPFRSVTVEAAFTAPSGRRVKTAGFYDGDVLWRVRFAPDEEGVWRCETQATPADEGLLLQSEFRCIPPVSHGFIGIHPENPYAFACSDGAPFFPMGDTAYGFYSDSHLTPELRREYLRVRRGQRFNFVRMGVVHSPTHWMSDPGFWPFGGAPQEPDCDRLNPVYFQGLDLLFREMLSFGMNVELLVETFYQSPFTDTSLWTREREEQWLRYVVARYAAFRNLFLWTLSNEYETHPDGVYRLDLPGDVEWAETTARFIRGQDPCRHPVTVHPVISASTKGERPRDPYDPPWRIGEFFGVNDAMDVLSHQHHGRDYGTWNEELQCMMGDGAGVEESILADRRYRKPVLNTENGYEYLRGYPHYNRQRHHTDKVRRASWRIVMAGGYFAAGFSGTLAMGDFWEKIDAPNEYPFVVRDEGAAAQLSYLYDFFQRVPYWRLEPHSEWVSDGNLCLAEAGRKYVVYLPRGGEVRLSLPQGVYNAEWLNPATGDYSTTHSIQGGGDAVFTAPFGGDATLHVTNSR